MMSYIKCRSRLSIFTLLACAVSGCLDVSAPKGELLSPDEIFHEIIVPKSYKMITIAKGEKVSLSADLISLSGEPLYPTEDLPLTWSVPNSQHVNVDANGVVTALSSSGLPSTIKVSWSYKGVTRSDSLLVSVTDSLYDIKAVVISPLDSLRLGFGGGMSMITVLPHTRNGTPVVDPNVLIMVEFIPHSGRGISVAPILLGGGTYGLYNFFYVGEYWIRATGYLYGRMYTDSLRLMGLEALFREVDINDNQMLNSLQSPQNNKDLVIQPCGWIEFKNNSSQIVFIDFDSPTAIIECGGSKPHEGSITVGPGQSDRRVMALAGSVEWTAAVLGTHSGEISGTIIARKPPSGSK